MEERKYKEYGEMVLSPSCIKTYIKRHLENKGTMNIVLGYSKPKKVNSNSKFKLGDLRELMRDAMCRRRDV